MKITITLANRLREVLTEGKWIAGTNYKEQLKDMDWRNAVNSIEDLNSVAKLTFHVDYYIDGVAQVLEGGTLDIRDKFSFNAPPINSKEDWDDLVNKFCKDSERFITLVSEMPEDKLQDIFVDKKYGSYHRNINGIIEHSYYHLGQILLIRKLLESRGKI